MAADKEIMKALETLRLDRPGRVYASLAAAVDRIDPPMPTDLATALTALAATYREEAELWTKSGARGWKSSETEAYLIAQALDDVATALGKLDPLSLEHIPTGTGVMAVAQTAPATTHERLDDLVQSAVAEGRGTIKPNLRSAASGTVLSNDMLRPLDEHADVTAYLKGEVDTLSGMADALVPGSVTDGTVHLGPVELIDNGNGSLANANAVNVTVSTGAGVRTLAPGDTITVGEHDTATVLPSDWSSDTMTADGHRLPGAALPQAPALGQPGDNSGMGYSHTYVPPGGRQVTYAELLTPIPAASLPPHLSHSQCNTIGDCATKYRLQRIEALPQVPQWANVGGTAFHAAVEFWEHMAAQHPGLSLREEDCEATWKHHFEGQINAVAATSPVPVSVWRASRKGAEGRQWWEVNGPLMLRRYLDARPDERTMIGLLANEVPSIELDLTVDVPTPYGPLPFNAVIDRISTRDYPDNTIVIRDYKTSYERPTDTTQLGDYAWALYLGGLNTEVKVYGSYFDARRGEWTTPVDLLEAHPFEAFQYRVTAAHAQKRALTTGPTPARPSSFCGGCSVRYACPIMAAKS